MIRTTIMFGLLLTSLWSQYPEEWAINPPDFEHTMTVTATVEVNGETSLNAGNALAVFHNEECRGVSEPILVGEIYMHFLMIYSNDQGLNLTFKSWDSAIGNVVDLDQTLGFLSGGTLGTVGEPYQFTGRNAISYLDAVDDSALQDEDDPTPASMDLLGNDTFYDLGLLEFTVIELPIHGTFDMNGNDDMFTYLPDENYFGMDSVQYSLYNGYMTDSAWVRIEVTPVNDPPNTFNLIGPGNGSYIQDVNATSIDFSWELPVDPEGDQLTSFLFVQQGTVWDTSFVLSSNTITLNVEGFPRDVWLDWFVRADESLASTLSDTFALKISDVVSVGREQVLPQYLSLGQNYPNPFNPVTSIGFGVPTDSHVKIRIYNLRNQEVRVLVDHNYSAGYHLVEWNSLDDSGNPLTSGIYFVVLESGSIREFRRILMLK